MGSKKVSRRKFLGMAATGAAMLPLKGSGLLPMAGASRQVLVPVDKGLSASWLASLTKRGKPKVYSGPALANIGMPIGGIGCGQIYLGGDGQLWNWDIFNQLGEGDMGEIRNGLHYSKPMPEVAPFRMGFVLAIGTATGDLLYPIDRVWAPNAEFTGSYPMAKVRYGSHHDVEVSLEAYSPFIPLNEDDSGLPVAVMSYTLKNLGTDTADVELSGWMENPACLYSRNRRSVELKTARAAPPGFSFFEHGASEVSDSSANRPNIVFEDFEKPTYEGWTVEGTAFGDGPIEIAKIPKYQGDVKGRGTRVVNSHNARQGESIDKADAHVGKLTSRSFTIERSFVTMLVGGGNHPGQTCVNLVVGGKIVRTETGRDSNEMSPVSWDVRDLAGQTAHIEIVDNVKGPWGNIGVDQIVFSDRAINEVEHLADEGDYGTIGIALLGDDASFKEQLKGWQTFWEVALHKSDGHLDAVGKRLRLKPGESQTLTFVVAWHFPNPNRKSLNFLQGHETFKRYYAKRFSDALAVAQYVALNFKRLERETRLWTETWYDSSLPYWFLDRTMANTSILSTSTVYRFDDGRFYGWEGVYCCAGTCTHVWQYAQAVGRLFPALERDTRQRVDYGIAYHESGALGHRAEAWQDPATDGQCGTILRVYREHLMNKDSDWLKSLWPRVRRSIEFMISQDPNMDGVLEGPQFNTLDATWYGKIAWISSLYVAALRAGEAMGLAAGDTEFAHKCAAIAEQGTQHISSELFNGEYFIQRVDPNFPKAINTNDGCHIDQVFGQSWAYQVGLPRVLPADKTRTALKSLYRYNYSPDVGKYRAAMKAIKGGRWYALAGEPGLLMCTWPKGGSEKAPGGGVDWAVGYFNECMTGFEHQVAAHMIFEGLVEEGLIVERTIHDRYDGAKRNPYNEIECSDHYARAMASYGVYLAACGFECSGPDGYLAFAPRLSADKFKAAFTSATGWGTYSQERTASRQVCRVAVKYGSVPFRRVAFECPWDSVMLRHGEQKVVGEKQADGKFVFALSPVEVSTGGVAEFVLTPT